MSLSLIASVAVLGASQLFKALVASVKERRLCIPILFSTGGMPSAHSAFVTTLTVSVALWYGVGSEIFALCVVFASIIVYDSVRLRGMVDTHSRILSDLQLRVSGSRGSTVQRRVGHSPSETVVGIVVGAAAAVLVHLLLLPVFPSGSVPG
jgi:hypothetical protein